MSIITINDVELELDLLDADVMEKYETLNNWIIEKVNEPTQYDGLSTAEGMRLQCRRVDEFFDKLFGAGTAEKLFHGSNNLGDRLEAFGEVSRASDDMGENIVKITEKYGAGRLQNREQRRHKGKKQQYHNRYRKGR